MPASPAATNGEGRAITILEQANAEQRAASDPLTSAFVAASAGSGKTKLLTDRLLRLMLAGTPPERILCLTYTKAAAAEMAIRLNGRLGQWVALPDAALDKALQALDVAATAKFRDTARKLFADVLDLPGGMRIGTIHAFCQSVLRRFPLEAELSPHFTLEDEFLAAARLRESREKILATADHRTAISALAAEANEQDFAALTKKFAAGENDIFSLLAQTSPAAFTAMQRAALAASEDDHDAILRKAIAWEREHHVKTSLLRFHDAGNPSGRTWALAALEWLAHDAESRFAKWVHWVETHFTGASKRRSLEKFYGKALAAERDALFREIDAEHARIETIEDSRRAARLAALNTNLMSVIRPILQTDAAQKRNAASVSYADLIAYTQNLLAKPNDVAWILYKLDGGIDHLLLDEVQDTAPAQWDITNAIAEDFFSGRGARDVNRTIFAVGDPKQSIFSFQGADLRSFSANRDIFRNRVESAGKSWLDGRLSVSFRSTAPILSLVDAVFADGFACQGVCPPGTLTHGVSRQGQAGAVTLLPLTKTDPAAPAPPWSVPDTYESAQSAKTTLAKSIALKIQTELATGRVLPSRNRPATPGDFLILVRHRDELVTAITRAAKELQIPIAGADRMVLTEQPAVADLLALCDSLLLPEDDLAFAHYLASPLGGLTDESLMDLALNRRTSLSATLFARRAERPDWDFASTLFQTLLAQADYISPYKLLARILHHHGGRARLLARLGPEAAEPIDEFLAEAETFAAQSPASLESFVFTLRQSGAAIKREAEAAGDVVRIMTVHGAKGLQAPIVILPDTTSLPNPRDSLYWLPVPQQGTKIPVYCPRAELRCSAVAAEAAAAKQADLEEYNRLLYVALTRAEDELIVAGAEGRKKIPDHCWYNAVLAGFARRNITPAADGTLTLTIAQSAPPDRQDTRRTRTHAVLPAWAGAAPAWRAPPPPAETTIPEPLAPSRSTDDPAKRAIAASPLGDNLAALRTARAAALAKGRAVHALLQHLPDRPATTRRAAAETYLTALNLPDTAAITGSVLAILENPTLAPLFGPTSRAEAPLAGVINGAEIGGLVDRLAVTDTAILLADYKTDRIPPQSPADIPPAYLRQLAAYAAILEQIFPARPITCTLIWTETATPMSIPPDLLRRHAPTHAQPSAT
jgi:ATP-dependent helicase/nuclease subunit A